MMPDRSILLAGAHPALAVVEQVTVSPLTRCVELLLSSGSVVEIPEFALHHPRGEIETLILHVAPQCTRDAIAEGFVR